ncbi:carbohydrate kinase [Flavihumibacter sp. R14]|nr:carbohydrate kinase [Flavihumibacter soli]
MNKQVLCFGEVLWDTFQEGKIAGGAPMNVAMHLRQQGVSASLASRIGEDEDGNKLREFLNTHNLDSELLQHDANLPTCVVSVTLDDQHQATYTIPYPVSWDNIQPEPSLLNAARQADVIVFGSLVCRDTTSRSTLEQLLKTDALKVFDVNLRAPHYHLDHLKELGGQSNIIKMNEEELDMLAGSELSHLSQKEKISFISDYFGCNTVCITRGGSGAIVLLNESYHEHPGFKVQVVDTVGAGDAFLATFIRGILTGEAPDLILRRACAIGAFVAGSRGANPVHDPEKITQIAGQDI